ncbi:MAG TPA: hypothetical protein DCR92_04565 [Faecalibacterium sp.]|nr:hypothetical protein [Faecalibacterium sp.]
MLAASLNAFFSLLRFEGPSAAAAAAPRRERGHPLRLLPMVAATSPKERGKKRSHYALGTLSKERQEALPPRPWLSLRESWREAPERAHFLAGAMLPQGASASRCRLPLRSLP